MVNFLHTYHKHLMLNLKEWSEASALADYVRNLNPPPPFPLPVQITDVGGLSLCKAAKGALVLSRLNMSHNAMGDGTMLAIADARRFNAGRNQDMSESVQAQDVFLVA